MNIELQVKLWDAINDYVVACGGDPGSHVYGNIPRMNAVAEVSSCLAPLHSAATQLWEALGEKQFYLEIATVYRDRTNWRSGTMAKRDNLATIITHDERNARDIKELGLSGLARLRHLRACAERYLEARGTRHEQNALDNLVDAVDLSRGL